MRLKLNDEAQDVANVIFLCLQGDFFDVKGIFMLMMMVSFETWQLDESEVK